MAKESEIKLRVQDLHLLRQKCHQLGAQEAHPRCLEDNLIFDRPDFQLVNQGKLLRLRQYAEKMTVTYKDQAVIQNSIKHREEIEFHIDSPEIFRSFLEKMGFFIQFRYQKYRQVFHCYANQFNPSLTPTVMNSEPARILKVMLDETPIGCYMELEGDEDLIHLAASHFGYSPKDYIAQSYADLYNEECRKKGQSTGHMVFEQPLPEAEKIGYRNTKYLDGKGIAQEIKSELLIRMEEFRKNGIQPGLAVILVGDNPASHLYVSSKVKTCADLGFYSKQILLPANTTTEAVSAEINRLNADEAIHGILVQLPLPSGIDTKIILSAVDPRKDVDGFHPLNIGTLCSGNPGLIPCTPAGILQILKRSHIEIKGKQAVVLGRSNIVGKPVAMLLLQEHATVTLCHSRTQDLPAICRQADILIAAIGKTAMVTAEFIKPGAVVIDVGINSIRDRSQLIELFGETSKRLEEFERKGYTLVGDVHPREVIGLAGHFTPVPGGVGPMTIAMLMWNTAKAAAHIHGLRWDE